MSVEVTPRGTRGARFPPPAPLKAIFVALSNVAFGLLGDRMRVQGRPVLQLETIGARSGAKRRAVVCWFPDREREDSWLIVASLAGGAKTSGLVPQPGAQPRPRMDRTRSSAVEGPRRIAARIRTR